MAKNTRPAQPEAEELKNEKPADEALKEPETAEAPKDEVAGETRPAQPEAEDGDGDADPEPDPEPEAAVEPPAHFKPLGGGITVTNTRSNVRFLSLPSGTLKLLPGAITTIPTADEEAFRRTMRSDTFKAIVDSGSLRISDYSQVAELSLQPTPAPPEDLVNPVQINANGTTTKDVEALRLDGFHNAGKQDA